MTRNLIMLFLLLTTKQLIFAQTTFTYKDDFKKIAEKTKDKSDSLSYDKLLIRFNVNDTTLTDFEVLALLIGFTNQPSFKPYTDINTESEIYDINGNGKYQEALDRANVFLKTHPVSVKVLFEKSYSFYKLGQRDSSVYYAYRGNRIFEAMTFSGNGKTPETPAFALGPADGQDYIRKYVSAKIGGAKIGVMGSGRDKNGHFLDILELVPKDGSEAYNLYFIIQHATDKMFSEEEIKKMQDTIEGLDKKDKKKE